MNVLYRLLKLLRMPGSRGRTTGKDRDRLPAKDPEPIELSQSQREQIETRIAEFIKASSSPYAHFYGVIARLNVLPLFFDWTAFIALRLDGQIVLVPYDDEPGEVEVIQKERVRNLGRFQGTKLHPELQFLVPPRPADAIDCPDCRGTGKLPFSKGSEHLADTVICSCGGVGWVPPGEKS
jgi:hypothetical protein